MADGEGSEGRPGPSLWSTHGAALIATSAAIAIALAGTAAGGGFAIREQSAYGLGSAYAGIAACGGSISSMFWNPAAVTCARGPTLEGHGTTIMPNIAIQPTRSEADFSGAPLVDLLTRLPVLGPIVEDNVNANLYGSGGSGNIGQNAFVPASYGAYPISDHWYAGFAINAPFGLVTKPESSEWAGRTYSRTSKVFSVEVTPTLGYRFNEALGVGVGFTVRYMKLVLKGANPFDPLTLLDLIRPPERKGSYSIEGDSLGWGVTAGLNWTPWPGTDIGIGFRSSMHHHIEGDVANLPNPDASLLDILFGSGSTLPSFKAETTLNTPETVTVSLRQKLTEKLTALGTVEWSNWSRLKTPRLVDSRTGEVVMPLGFKWDDAWFFAAGLEYAFNDRLTLRGGAGWELSPITDFNRDTRLPDDDRLWLSVGASYAPRPNLVLDLAYTYIRAFGTTINIDRDNPHHLETAGIGLDFEGNVDADVHMIAAGLRYTF